MPENAKTYKQADPVLRAFPGQKRSAQGDELYRELDTLTSRSAGRIRESQLADIRTSMAQVVDAVRSFEEKLQQSNDYRTDFQDTINLAYECISALQHYARLKSGATDSAIIHLTRLNKPQEKYRNKAMYMRAQSSYADSLEEIANKAQTDSADMLPELKRMSTAVEQWQNEIDAECARQKIPRWKLKHVLIGGAIIALAIPAAILAGLTFAPILGGVGVLVLPIIGEASVVAMGGIFGCGVLATALAEFGIYSLCGSRVDPELQNIYNELLRQIGQFKSTIEQFKQSIRAEGDFAKACSEGVRVARISLSSESPLDTSEVYTSWIKNLEELRRVWNEIASIENRNSNRG